MKIAYKSSKMIKPVDDVGYATKMRQVHEMSAADDDDDESDDDPRHRLRRRWEEFSELAPAAASSPQPGPVRRRKSRTNLFYVQTHSFALCEVKR